MNEIEALAVFSTLSNPTRLEILKYLVVAGENGMTAGKIAKATGATPSRASFHLSNMSKAGLIISTRQSRQILYHVQFKTVGGLIRYIMQDCCKDNKTLRACCNNSC